MVKVLVIIKIPILMVLKQSPILTIKRDNMNQLIRIQKDINYLNIPKINLKEIIVDYKQVNKELSEFYSNKSNSDDYNKGYMDFIKKDIVKFKKTQSQTISYMVKEFEMRKSADLYKRSTVAKTGQLNMNTLHSYSYNEDIFLKMNVEPALQIMD